MTLLEEIEAHLESNKFTSQSLYFYMTKLNVEFIKATDNDYRHKVMDASEKLDFIIRNIHSCEALAKKYGMVMVMRYQVPLWLKLGRWWKKILENNFWKKNFQK
jgi:ABC-type antimicrobial peptide transport system ATPase subunit